MAEVAQMNLDYAWERPDWTALQVISEEVEDALSQDACNLLYCLSNWFMAVTIFKRFEEREIVLKEADLRDREYHRVSLTGLLANGEKLLQQLRKHETVDTTCVGVGLADVAATVEDLRFCYSEWFGGMTPARKAEILKGVFGVET